MITKFKIFESAQFAPNGKQSNLKPVQYDLVRTDAFKQWFGDWENEPEKSSNIIDENNEPKVVYHGSPYRKFSEFKKGSGIFFSESYKFAKEYGEDKSFAGGMDADVIVYEVFLNLRNIFNINNTSHRNLLTSWLPDNISVGLYGKEFPKDEFVSMLQGNYTLQPYWTKDKIEKAEFGKEIGTARDGFNNDIFIGIDKDNKVVYIAHYLYDVVHLLSKEQIQELIDGKKVTLKGYKWKGKLYTGDELNAASKAGEISDNDRVRSISYGSVNTKIAPYKESQEIEYVTGQDTWQLYELNNVDLFEKIESHGFDGLTLQEKGHKNIVVFNPLNIKLADGTNTTFNKNNPDMRK